MGVAAVPRCVLSKRNCGLVVHLRPDTLPTDANAVVLTPRIQAPHDFQCRYCRMRTRKDRAEPNNPIVTGVWSRCTQAKPNRSISTSTSGDEISS